MFNEDTLKRQGIAKIKKQFIEQIKMLSQKWEEPVKLVIGNDAEEDGDTWLYVVNEKGAVLEKKKIAEVIQQIKDQLIVTIEKNMNVIKMFPFQQVQEFIEDVKNFHPTEYANRLYVYLATQQIKHEADSVKYIIYTRKEARRAQVPGMKPFTKTTLNYYFVKHTPSPTIIQKGTADEFLAPIFSQLLFAGKKKKDSSSLPENSPQTS
ncbi:hypothetical protein BKI52_33040 [marine bacterium AO1-C]|nr:hypothetical protein BKI52_33040 [marine bacterium AO1-C]